MFELIFTQERKREFFSTSFAVILSAVALPIELKAEFNFELIPRLLPNRSPVAWGSQRIALGPLIFHSNTFHFIHVLYVGLLSSQRLALRAPLKFS